MTAVGIATATAGIIVGTVTLTGIGLVMTEIVEFLSAGNFVIMLVLTGLICLVLGTGLPTTASYVVVATLMAPVVVELAAQNDVAVPLIAVHMFAFYFGLMAGVSPPVGLAAYAAGAIAGADPLKVGWQGMRYENRTALLPFVFVFNPENLDDRHRRRRAFFTGGRLRRIGDGHLCGGEPKLAANAQPLVGDAGLAPHLLHAIPTGFLARSTAGAIRGASRRSTGHAGRDGAVGLDPAHARREPVPLGRRRREARAPKHAPG